VSFEFPGVVEAEETASIRPQVSGTLVARHVTPGAMVEKGQPLFAIDEADFKSAFAEAEATLQSAQAEARVASSNWDRAQELKPDGYISQQDYDRAESRVGVTQAAVARAQAALDTAQLNLDRTRIAAPFAGKISAAKVGTGDYVTPSNVLCEIVKLDPVYVVSAVDQKIYDRFMQRRAEFDAAGEAMPEPELTIVLPTGTVFPHTGAFENWDAFSGSSGTIAGRIRVPNPAGILLPGVNVSVRGQGNESRAMPVVPQKAVGQDQQGQYVFTVDDTHAVQRRNLELGTRAGENWTVIGGVEAGDRVIVEGLQKVRPGMTVDAEMSGS
jgi:RND family efflux transporter MFP subunit